jgi:hypothetical protein
MARSTTSCGRSSSALGRDPAIIAFDSGARVEYDLGVTLRLVFLAVAMAGTAHGERCKARGVECTFTPQPATHATKPGSGAAFGRISTTFHSGVPGGHSNTTNHACAIEVHDAKDKLVTNVKSNADGNYSVDLRPGHYWIDVASCFACDPGQPDFDIAKDAAIKLDVHCDIFGK